MATRETAGGRGRTGTAGAAEDNGGMVAAIGRMADGLSRLFTESLHLAQVELREDAKGFARDSALIGAFGVLVLVGYVLACVAAGLGLARWIGGPLAFLVVAGVNLVAGGVGAFIAVRSLGRRPEHLLETTRTEMQESVHELKELGQGVPERRAVAVVPHEAEPGTALLPPADGPAAARPPAPHPGPGGVPHASHQRRESRA